MGKDTIMCCLAWLKDGFGCGKEEKWVCDPTLIVSAIEDSAFDAVTKLLKKEKEDLEIELAKTKLALVETECKNQDLTHQLSVVNDASSNSQQQANKTWFSGKSIFNSANRTLSSIRYDH